jgi:hypothetical protein
MVKTKKMVNNNIYIDEVNKKKKKFPDYEQFSSLETNLKEGEEEKKNIRELVRTAVKSLVDQEDTTKIYIDDFEETKQAAEGAYLGK